MGHCGSLDIRPCGLRHGVSVGGTYIVPQTFFCANGCAGDKVEIPITAVRKSLPKKRKNAGVLTKQKKRTGKSALMVGKEAGSCLIFGGKRVI